MEEPKEEAIRQNDPVAKDAVTENLEQEGAMQNKKERPATRGNYQSDEQRYAHIDLVVDGKVNNQESRSVHMM
jgi:hypothetical protein